MQKYLVLDDNARLVSVETTAAGAREVARDFAPGHVVDETGGCKPPVEARDNPARENPMMTSRRGGKPERFFRGGGAEHAPAIILDAKEAQAKQGNRAVKGQLAFEMSQLPQVTTEEVLELTEGMSTLKHVFKRLEPFLRRDTASGIGASEAMMGQWKHLLKSNFKLGKDGNVMGLSLTPFWQGMQMLDALADAFPTKAPGQLFGTAAKNGKSLPILYDLVSNPKFFETMPRGARTLCAGSSTACRSACLALSGQQLTDFGLKMALTEALVQDTVAFCAMLAWNCLGFFRSSDAKYTFIRLNVLSDVPWEIVFPGLFDLMDEAGFSARGSKGERRGFYDYTKVDPMSREQPDSYDWTFSFSGANWPAVENAMAHGFRTAVVFAPVDMRRSGAQTKDRLAEMPETFMGHQVVDGDNDDMRALDPPGVVVGLTYKAPKKVSAEAIRGMRQKSGFVVPVVEMDGRFIAAHIPRHSHAEQFDHPDPAVKQELRRHGY